jgi:hypothetical protein
MRCTEVRFATLDQLLFISYFVFRRQSAEFYFSKKNCQIKAGQNNKHDITKTPDLMHFDEPTQINLKNSDSNSKLYLSSGMSCIDGIGVLNPYLGMYSCTLSLC